MPRGFGQTLTVYLALDAAKFASGLDRANRSTRGLVDQVSKMALVVGGATVAGFGVASRTFVEYDSALVGVRKTVDGTATQISGLSDEFRRLAVDLPVTAAELATIGEKVGQVGVAIGDIPDFSIVLSELDITTDLVGAQAALDLARFASVTGTAHSEVRGLASGLVALGNNFAATEQEILEFSKRLAPMGDRFGLTAAQIEGFATAALAAGITSEQGSTALTKVMNELRTATIRGGESLEIFAATSRLSVEEFKALYREDAAGALVAFIDGLGNLGRTGGDTAAVIEDLGLTAVRTQLTLGALGNSVPQLERALAVATAGVEDATALGDEAAKAYDSWAARLDTVMGKFNEYGLIIGERVIPPLVMFLELFVQLGDLFINAPSWLQTVIIGLVAVGALVLTTAGLFGFLYLRVLQVKDAMNQLAVASTRAGTALKYAQSAAGWIGAAIVVTTALAFAFGSAAEEAWDLSAALKLGDEEFAANLNKIRAVYQVLNDDGSGQKFIDKIGEGTGGLAALLRYQETLAATDPIADLVATKINELTAAHANLTAAQTAEQEQLGLNQSGFSDLTAGIVDGTQALAAFNAEWENWLNNSLAVTEASYANAQAIADVTDALIANGTSFSRLTGAGRDNAAMVNEAIRVAQEHAQAIFESSGSAEQANEAFYRQVVALRLTSDAVGEYLNQIGLTPTKAFTLFVANTGAARNSIDIINNEIASVPRRVQIEFEVRFNQVGSAWESEIAQRVAAQQGLPNTGSSRNKRTGGGGGGGSDAWKEYFDRIDREYKVGLRSRASYLQELARLQDAETVLTDRWYQIWQRRGNVQTEGVREQLQQMKFLHEQGLASTRSYFDELSSIMETEEFGSDLWRSAYADFERLSEETTALMDRRIDAWNRIEESRGRSARIAAQKVFLTIEQLERIADDSVTRGEALQKIGAALGESVADYIDSLNLGLYTLTQLVAEAERLEASTKNIDSFLDKIEEYQRRIHDSITDVVDLVDLFTDRSVGSDEIVNALDHRVAAAERWADALKQLEAQNIPQQLLQDLIAKGPEALGLAEGLLGVNSQQLDQLFSRASNIGLDLVSQFGLSNVNQLRNDVLANAPGGFTQQFRPQLLLPDGITVTISNIDLTADPEALRETVRTEVGSAFEETLRGLTNA